MDENRILTAKSLLLKQGPDQRSFPVGKHQGVIRLRVWPATVEETQHALARLLEQVEDNELLGALVNIGPRYIRVRSPQRGR